MIDFFEKWFLGEEMANIRKKLGLYCRIFYKYQDLIAEYLENIPNINAEISEKHRT